ncbi:MAG: protein kinase [Polyangiaceae bacterium]|nr:protein kinase [Polyangiaceae bacterium]
MDLLAPGQIFADRYRIERFLAQGGMGAVFVAEHLATEQIVALKVLFPHVLASRNAVDRFQLEARVAARVKSPHIVSVLDAGFDEATRAPFLVMEMLSGSSLEDVVQCSGPLTAPQAVTYMAQCCSGLDKAHTYRDKSGQLQPIVHRDLKPDNLFLVEQEGCEPLVKILDFGIAKVLSSTANLSQEVKGTPLFMAFEQAAGRPITPQTDIWAVGLITFFMLTGRSYWLTANLPAGEVAALFGEILTRPIVPPSVRAAELGATLPVGPAYDAWFLRCLDREPMQRFGTAGDAALELGRALGVEVILPGTGGVTPRSALGGLPVAIAQTAAETGVGETRDQIALSATTRSGRAPASSLGVVAAVALVTVVALVGGALYLLARRDAPPAGDAERAAQAESPPRHAGTGLPSSAPSSPSPPDVSPVVKAGAAPEALTDVGAPSAAPTPRASTPPAAAATSPAPRRPSTPAARSTSAPQAATSPTAKPPVATAAPKDVFGER